MTPDAPRTETESLALAVDALRSQIADPLLNDHDRGVYENALGLVLDALGRKVDPPVRRASWSALTARVRHFGDEHHSGHISNSDFDFYCVAHGEDYSPKYLDGAVCHDGMGEGWCHPDCRACPKPCPIRPCPLVDEYGDLR
jgi:hypothetical protein